MVNTNTRIALMEDVAKSRYGKRVSELLINEATECGRVVREAIRIYRAKKAAGRSCFIH